ncbi:MAG TPA: phosphatidylserine decarboxylase family protein [Chitinophagaceae bacterium]|nr:phosphatidylserine decarboxylase family protein [Chitinophagaceae bacterium]
MHIHKEGYPTIGITLGVLIIINVLVWLSAGEALSWVVTGLSILLFLCIVSFFRIPHRVMITNEHYVIAPADGKVVAIEETLEPEYFKGKRLQVSIFMSPANVHVNRNPVSGEVRLSAYHPGKYLVAWHPKSSTLNEHHTVVLRHRHGDILVRQIAGAMARRIVNYLEPGMEVSQNAEMGFIKFGSRVDLLLPLTAKLEVKLNQKVKGGQTVIAELLQPGNSV